jgi:2-dehydropantoate 2-reductase
MNIIVFGAGAIGSLFGALLSKNNQVLLIGRKPHINAIRKNGLIIEGKTQMNVKISSEFSTDKISILPELLILTVKSYDTISAMIQAQNIINDETVVLSLQNGLDNIEKIEKIVNRKQIITGITTHGVLFDKPGFIKHTGLGNTILGEINGKKSKRLNRIVKIFNQSGIETAASEKIIQEIWTKAIVNSSINPLTTFSRCKNGYLLENPILVRIIERVCRESTSIANFYNINLSYETIIKITKKVIKITAQNYSSMYQSYKKGKKTEIDSLNGKLTEIGKKYNADTTLNEILTYIIKSQFFKNIFCET